MKVVKVNIYKHDMQLKAPWAIAGRVMESVENIFITVQRLLHEWYPWE